MTPQQTVALAVRLFSVWLVFLVFQVLAMAVASAGQFNGGASAWVGALALVPAVLALLLWTYPMAVANKLVPRTHDTDIVRMPVRQGAAAATAILGVWAIIGSFPALVGALGVALFLRDGGYSGMYFDQVRLTQLLFVFAQSGLGFFLVFKPWSVADKILPARASGAGASE